MAPKRLPSFLCVVLIFLRFVRSFLLPEGSSYTCQKNRPTRNKKPCARVLSAFGNATHNSETGRKFWLVDDDSKTSRTQIEGQYKFNTLGLEKTESKDPMSMEGNATMVLEGGLKTIFQMVQRMQLWDDPCTTPPRWRPVDGGISNENPSFRDKAPSMNSIGYANVIRRNSRKRKQAMWRYSYNTYQRLLSESAIIPKTEHHQSALVSTGKLGWWKEAFEIVGNIRRQKESHPELDEQTRNNDYKLTNSMIYSLIKACVRGAKNIPKERPLEERQAPLDHLKHWLVELKTQYGFTMLPSHVNPLASAYQSIGLHDESTRILLELLPQRLPRDHDSTDDPQPDRFNVGDIQAKDKGSYALLVRDAIANDAWGEAVTSLKEMTEGGLYPDGRTINSWAEFSSKKKRYISMRRFDKSSNQNSDEEM